MRRLLLLLLLVLAATGCQAGSQVVVHPDGSGTYSVVLTAPSGSGDAGGRLYAAMRKAAARSTVPMTVQHHSAKGEEGVEASFAFRSLADLRAEAAAMGGASDPLAGVTVGRNATGWAFSASSADGLTRPPGQAAGSSPGGSIDAGRVVGLIRMTVSVQLPGAPAKTNADEVRHDKDTSTFSWNLASGRAPGGLAAQTTFQGEQASVPAAQELTTLLLPTAGGGGPGPHSTLLLALAAGAVGAACLVGVALLRRRRAAAVPA